ncbi:MAG: ABC transporter permease [Bacteroidetes bacterium]|nr:ABC transporter permease [Bacteroidota bacterium]
MKRYLIRRLLFFIPALVVISLLAFAISINAPGDPVERLLSSGSDDGNSINDLNTNKQKEFWRKKLGLDLPLFYLSFRSKSYPETNLTFSNEKQQKALEKLAFSNGDGENAANFHNQRASFSDDLRQYKKVYSEVLWNDVMLHLNMMNHATDYIQAQQALNSIETIVKKVPEVRSLTWDSYITLKKNIQNGIRTDATINNLIPQIRIHADNLYHRWLFGDGNWLTGAGATYSKGIVRGDFGISYQTRQPVSEVIGQKAGWSLLLSLLSVLFAYLISIPAGVWAGIHKEGRFDKSSALLWFVLYSMPSFWLATLLLMLFANPDIIHWFPASGVKPATGYPADAGILEKIQLSIPYLILPLICYTYSSFAFLSRTMRVNIIEQMGQDYIRTAKAKGLSLNRIAFVHALRNSMLPLITVFANIFPAALGGSVILETIFTIPGMGYETYLSIQNQNYPMIVAIFTITGFLTIAGFLIADILYAVADPRIQFRSETNKS